MNAYIYQAALYCKDCGASIREHLAREGRAPSNPSDEATFDSDEYPKGPYPDGGGEADCPNHCDGCGMFLENPLTSDGYEYIAEAVARGGDVAELWADFYGIEGREAT